MINPYRTYAPRTPSKRGVLWRFRVWLALLIAPPGEDSFEARWDVSDEAKRLALSWDRGYVRSVEWNPECMNCGERSPIDSHCRHCGSFERRLEDRIEHMERRLNDMTAMLEHAKRRQRSA